MAVIAAFCIGVAFAGAGDSVNVFGILEVSSMSTNTIVSVPWVNLGKGEEKSIRACDLVLTNNLTVGDMIFVYNADRRLSNQEYTGWVLGETGWEGLVNVTENKLYNAPDAENSLVKRGKAFWLQRQRPIEGGKAVKFYLCGQYSENAAEPVLIEPGTKEAPAYHLVACPSGEDRAINDFGWKGYNIDVNDTLEVPQNNINGVKTLYKFDHETDRWYYYKTSAWGGSTKKYDGVAKAGTGFWYVSRGGRMTIKW